MPQADPYSAELPPPVSVGNLLKREAELDQRIADVNSELQRQKEETAQLKPVLWGLNERYRGDLHKMASSRAFPTGGGVGYDGERGLTRSSRFSCRWKRWSRPSPRARRWRRRPGRPAERLLDDWAGAVGLGSAGRQEQVDLVEE